ncbi:MAG: MAC/perforin domain-containing protein [Dysgonomonas sp.]
MKKYITVLLLTILLFSCSNELYDTDSNENNQNTPSLKFGGDGKFDALGYGADVTQEFLATEKAAVIDNDRLDKEAPNRIAWNLNNRQYYTEYSGATASSMLKEIASKKAISISAGYSGVSALFKASFENKNSTRKTTNYSYGEYHLIIKKKEFRYNFSFSETGSDQLRKYVTDNFKKDVENLPPRELIKIYGTHVYTHVVLGGELTVTYSSEILSTENKETKKMAVEAGMEASIGSLFKLSTSVEVGEEKNKEMTQMNSNQRINYETRGGDARLGVVGSISFDGKTQQQIDLTKWQESCTSENVNLIDFDPGTLIPLWMFVEPGAKQDELKQAIAKYIEENEFEDKKPEKTINYIKKIYISANSCEEKAISNLRSQSWEKLNVIKKDLNEGAGGDYIYIGYTTTTKKEEAIRDLIIRFHKNPPTAYFVNNSYYSKVANINLNKGTGESTEDIWLYESRNSNLGNPITDLYVETVRNYSDRRVPSGQWRKVNLIDGSRRDPDLNAKAGGEYIYLWMQK